MLCLWPTIARIRCLKRVQSRVVGLRAYSSPSKAESVIVPCQSNGSISLDIHHPLISSSTHELSPAVIIYLPRGPLLENHQHDASTVSTLLSNSACSIVQINYRMSRSCQYPTPVHDVLTGFDWIVENLLPKRAITRIGRSAHLGKLAVCGELIGGGLATMLALTECRRDDAAVLTAAVNNPVVDWVSLTQAGSTSAPKKKSAIAKSSSTLDLLELRPRLFMKPEHYFDPFASPILFFRSAGMEVPAGPPDAFQEISQDDMEQLSMLEREYANETDHNPNQNPPQDQSEDKVPVTKRKTSRRFPSQALGLRLPSFYISAGSTSPLADQSKELTHLLRQSIVRQSKYGSGATPGFGRKVHLDEEVDQLEEDEKAVQKLQKQKAEEKAHLTSVDGFGLWDDSADGHARVVEVAKWLKTHLT